MARNPADDSHGGRLPPRYRAGEAAAVLGVSADTVRRWAESGRFEARPDPSGRWSVDGRELARVAAERAQERTEGATAPTAPNRFRGIVTTVTCDGVSARVDIQAGPLRFTALTTVETVEEMGLVRGSMAEAVVAPATVSVQSGGSGP